MTIATDMFERRMQSIASGDRPGANKLLAEQLWQANPREHASFIGIAEKCGMLEWKWDFNADGEIDILEVKLLGMHIMEMCPTYIIDILLEVGGE